jgi:hypothetical protein
VRVAVRQQPTWYGPFTLFAGSAKQSGCPTRQPHATVNRQSLSNIIKDDGQSGSGRASGKVHTLGATASARTTLYHLVQEHFETGPSRG